MQPIPYFSRRTLQEVIHLVVTLPNPLQKSCFKKTIFCKNVWTPLPPCGQCWGEETKEKGCHSTLTQEGERGSKYDRNHPKGTRVQRTYAKDCLCKIRFVGYLKHFAFTTDWALGDFCKVPNTKNNLGSPDTFIWSQPNTCEEKRSNTWLWFGPVLLLLTWAERFCVASANINHFFRSHHSWFNKN